MGVWVKRLMSGCGRDVARIVQVQAGIGSCSGAGCICILAGFIVACIVYRILSALGYVPCADPSGRPVPLGYLPEHIPPSTNQLTNFTDGCDGFDVVI